MLVSYFLRKFNKDSIGWNILPVERITMICLDSIGKKENEMLPGLFL